MAANDRLYDYKPLEGEDHIRLLHLVSGREDKIQVQLVHFSISDAPAYVAFSYILGGDDCSSMYKLPMEVYLSRAHLHSTLRKLCLLPAAGLHSTGWSWADAISIDWGSNAE